MLDAKVCPSLATLVPNLNEKVKDFILQADKSGYDVIIRSLPQMFEKTTSFFIEPIKDSNHVKIHLICHIPMAQKNEIFELYKFLPESIPIFTNNIPHGLTLMNKHDIIAFSDKQETFVTFKSSELRNCQQTARFFFCDNVNSVKSYSHLPESCLGSLLKLNSSSILNACPHHPSELKPTATKRSPNEWLLYGGPHNGTKLEQECNNNGKKEKKLKIIINFEEIVLDENCRAKFGSHYFHSAPNYETKSVKAYLPVEHWFPRELTEHLGISGGISDKELIAGLSKLDPNQNSNNMEDWRKNLQAYRNRKDYTPDTHQTVSYALIGFLFLVVLVAVIVVVFMAKKCVCASPKPGESNEENNYHSGQTMKNNVAKTEAIR